MQCYNLTLAVLYRAKHVTCDELCPVQRKWKQRHEHVDRHHVPHTCCNLLLRYTCPLVINVGQIEALEQAHLLQVERSALLGVPVPEATRSRTCKGRALLHKVVRVLLAGAHIDNDMLEEWVATIRNDLCIGVENIPLPKVVIWMWAPLTLWQRCDDGIEWDHRRIGTWPVRDSASIAPTVIAADCDQIPARALVWEAEVGCVQDVVIHIVTQGLDRLHAVIRGLLKPNMEILHILDDNEDGLLLSNVLQTVFIQAAIRMSCALLFPQCTVLGTWRPSQVHIHCRHGAIISQLDVVDELLWGMAVFDDACACAILLLNCNQNP